MTNTNNSSISLMNSTMNNTLDQYFRTINGTINSTSTMNNETLNSTIDPAQVTFKWIPVPLAIFLLIFEILLGIFICFSNALVFMVYIKFRDLRTVTNTLIVTLSIVDFITGLTACFLHPITNYLQFITHVDDTINNSLCFSRFLVYISSMMLSIINLTLMMLERYLKTVFPNWHAKYITYKTISMIIIITWLLQLLVVYLPMTLGAFIRKPYDICRFVTVFHRTYILTLKVEIGVMLTFSSILSVAMIHYIRKVNRIVDIGNIAGVKDNQRLTMMKKDRVVTLTICTVMAVFWICWAQFLLLSTLLKFGQDGPLLPYLLMAVSGNVALGNSMINPWIYAWRHKEIKTAMKKAMSCLTRGASQMEENTLDNPPTVRRTDAAMGLSIQDNMAAVDREEKSIYTVCSKDVKVEHPENIVKYHKGTGIHF